MDSEYEEKRKRPKRQHVLQQLKKSKVSTKALEEFLRLHGGSRTSTLFSIPPCEVKESDFKVRYGMIKFDNRMPSYDRFRSIEIPDTTLRCINSLIATDILYSTEFQGSGMGEQQVASVLDRVSRDLGRFTKPRPQQEEEATYQTSQNELPRGKMDLAIKVALHAHTDPEPEAGQEASEGSSSDDQEGQTFESTAAAPRQHSGLKLFVYKSQHTVNGMRLKVVNDSKTLAGTQNLLQPAMYTIDELRTTAGFLKAYRPPVYLMTQDVHNWYYAILEIDGYINIRNGVIENLEGFPEADEVVNAAKFTPSFTQSEVSANFAEWKRSMDSENLFIPNGLHPVGRLFMRPVQKYEVPNLGPEQALLSGQKRYYDGLLKILVGRGRVTRWSPEDAIDAWNARKSLEEKAVRTSGLPENLWSRVLQS